MVWQVSRNLDGIRCIQKVIKVSSYQTAKTYRQESWRLETRQGIHMVKRTKALSRVRSDGYSLKYTTTWVITKPESLWRNVGLDLYQVSSVQLRTYIDAKSPPIRSDPNVFGMLTVAIARIMKTTKRNKMVEK
jgi:hypothetical protein